MSILAMPRGSQASGLPARPAQNLKPTPALAGRVPGVHTTAPPNPERVKQKPSTTMTTTVSPPVETTTTVPGVDVTSGTTTPTARQRRVNTFLAGLMDDRLDTTTLQREALLRLQLR